MFVRKVDRLADEAGEVSVIVEPRPGHVDDEIVDRLRELGAQDIKVLAEGFISARGRMQRLEELNPIAYVAPKPAKQMR